MLYGSLPWLGICGRAGIDQPTEHSHAASRQSVRPGLPRRRAAGPRRVPAAEAGPPTRGRRPAALQALPRRRAHRREPAEAGRGHQGEGKDPLRLDLGRPPHDGGPARRRRLPAAAREGLPRAPGRQGRPDGPGIRPRQQGLCGRGDLVAALRRIARDQQAPPRHRGPRARRQRLLQQRAARQARPRAADAAARARGPAVRRQLRLQNDHPRVARPRQGPAVVPRGAIPPASAAGRAAPASVRRPRRALARAGPWPWRAGRLPSAAGSRRAAAPGR